jgi:hypothetical protein
MSNFSRLARREGGSGVGVWHILLAVALLAGCSARRQEIGQGGATDAGSESPHLADAAEVRVAGGGPMGSVFARIDGTWRPIADRAWGAWVVEAGGAVVFSSDGGAGGYEDEGHSLHRYDVDAGTTVAVVRETALVASVVSTTAPSGQTVYLVQLRDGGLGAPQATIVVSDGRVLHRARPATVRLLDRGVIELSHYRFEEIEQEGPAGAQPVRRETIHLASLFDAAGISRTPSDRSASPRG